jgi:hypothetical protein
VRTLTWAHSMGPYSSRHDKSPEQSFTRCTLHKKPTLTLTCLLPLLCINRAPGPGLREPPRGGAGLELRAQGGGRQGGRLQAGCSALAQVSHICLSFPRQGQGMRVPENHAALLALLNKSSYLLVLSLGTRSPRAFWPPSTSATWASSTSTTCPTCPTCRRYAASHMTSSDRLLGRQRCHTRHACT